MPACADLRHERFARELVEQLLRVPPAKQPQLEAYRLAGFKPHRGNCYRLARQPDVAARIAELMAEAREYLDLRIVKALVQVGRIANALLPAYYEAVDADGTLKVRDITVLPSALQEAIAEVELDDDGKPRRIKLHDKMQALAILLKHFGGLPEEAPKTEVNIYNALSGLNAEDQAALADALEALGRDQVDAVAGPAAPLGGSSEAP